MWQQSVSNEVVRLAGGVRQVSENSVVEFIQKNSVPSTKKATHANMVCDVQPKKDNVNRARLITGGNKLDYYEDASSPAASLIETKLLNNSVIFNSHKDTIFLMLDIKYQFLLSIPTESEYVRS